MKNKKRNIRCWVDWEAGMIYSAFIILGWIIGRVCEAIARGYSIY